MKNLFTLFIASAIVFCFVSMPVKFTVLQANAQELKENFEEEKKEEKKKEEKPEVKKQEQQEELMEEPGKPAPKKQGEQMELLEDVPDQVPEELQYFKDVYEITFDASFDVVYNAVKKSLENLSCQTIKNTYKQSDDGFYKGYINSDYCVVSNSNDSTIKVMKKLSFAASEEKYNRKKFPIIRGGTWLYGRMQYRFVITEKDNNKVHVLLKGELSGFEDYVTNKVHFWDSNGFLETRMLERLTKNVALLKK